ncbi:MAG: FAD-dependent oxidoreductase [Deinococcales bacterium]
MLTVIDAQQTWDVIVLGGGTAGAIAAIKAARAGVKTLVVEALGSLGGTGTNAQVTPLMRNVSNGVRLNQGLTNELKTRLFLQGDGAVDRNANDNWFNPEGMKYILERMLVESGGEILYHTHFVDSELESEVVQSVIVHNKDGLTRLRAKAFIDATGDADLCVRAGAPFQAGELETGLHQAMSLRFILGGVDLERLCEFLGKHGQAQESKNFMHFWMVWGKNASLEPLFRQAVIDGLLEERDGDYFQGFSVPGMPGCISFNNPRLAAEINDGADAWTLSKAQIDGKHAIARIVNFLRQRFEGCENSFVSSYAAMPGVRETRRIRGEYVLTLEDILYCQKFPDAICRNHYPVDIHTPRGQKLYHERSGDLPYFAPDAYHEIPFRCLIPLGLANVLVPGRCASATFEAQSAIRVQQNCHSMGEAAGLAAAWMAERQLGSRDIDTLELRQALVSGGAYL